MEEARRKREAKKKAKGLDGSPWSSPVGSPAPQKKNNPFLPSASPASPSTPRAAGGRPPQSPSTLRASTSTAAAAATHLQDALQMESDAPRPAPMLKRRGAKLNLLSAAGEQGSSVPPSDAPPQSDAPRPAPMLKRRGAKLNLLSAAGEQGSSVPPSDAPPQSDAPRPAPMLKRRGAKLNLLSAAGEQGSSVPLQGGAHDGNAAGTAGTASILSSFDALQAKLDATDAMLGSTTHTHDLDPVNDLQLDSDMSGTWVDEDNGTDGNHGSNDASPARKYMSTVSVSPDSSFLGSDIQGTGAAGTAVDTHVSLELSDFTETSLNVGASPSNSKGNASGTDTAQASKMWEQLQEAEVIQAEAEAARVKAEASEAAAEAARVKAEASEAAAEAARVTAEAAQAQAQAHASTAEASQSQILTSRPLFFKMAQNLDLRCVLYRSQHLGCWGQNTSPYAQGCDLS